MRYTVVFCFPKAAWGGKNRSKPAEGTRVREGFLRTFCFIEAVKRKDNIFYFGRI